MMIYLLVFMFVLVMQNKYLPTLASLEHLKPHIGDCFVCNESFLGQPGIENSPSWEMSLMCHKWDILWSHMCPLSPLPPVVCQPGTQTFSGGINLLTYEEVGELEIREIIMTLGVAHNQIIIYNKNNDNNDNSTVAGQPQIIFYPPVLYLIFAKFRFL